MTSLALAAVLLVLSGCAAFRPNLPPWARPVPGPPSPAPVPVQEEPAPVVATPAPPPAAPPAPVPATSPPPASPPIATPAPAPAARPAPPHVAAPAPATPAPPPTPAGPGPQLTASLPPAEVRRLQDEAQRGIDDAERLLRQLDSRALTPKDLETLRLAQGLVEQARRALGGQEYERAANLATKARTLADDLTAHR